MTKRLVPILSLALPLLGAVPALAGPGALPTWMWPPKSPVENHGAPSYALTGRTRSDDTVMRARLVDVGGGRGRAIVYDRVDRLDVR